MQKEIKKIEEALKSVTAKFGLDDTRSKSLLKTRSVLEGILQPGPVNTERVIEEMARLEEIRDIIADPSTKRFWEKDEDPEREKIKEKVLGNREKVLIRTSSLFNILEENPIVRIKLCDDKLMFAQFASLNPRGSWDIFEDPYSLDRTACDYGLFASKEGEWVINSHQNHSDDSNWLREFVLMEYSGLLLLVLVMH